MIYVKYRGEKYMLRNALEVFEFAKMTNNPQFNYFFSFNVSNNLQV